MGKMTAKDIDLVTLLTKNNFYIPSYQRGYSWKDKNVEQLFGDLINHLTTKPTSDYYMGNIIVFNERDGLKNKLVIVDGQQRITTFMLLITAMRVSIFSSDSTKDEIRRIDDKLKELILSRESRDSVEKRIKLFFSKRETIISEILSLKLEDKDLKKNKWLLDINRKHKETNYLKNLEIFIKLINKNMKTNDDYLNFLDLMGRIVFVIIDVENDENVHEIFENINSKGIDLSLSDLIKNFLYILLEKYDYSQNTKLEMEEKISKIFEEDIEKLKTENSVIITNYLIFLKEQHFNKTKEKEVYGEIKEYILDRIEIDLSLEKIIKQINEQLSLMKYIEDYSSFNSSNLFELSLFLNKTNLTGVIFPFVYEMALNYKCFNSEDEFEINGEFEDFIILMDKFFSRRYLYGSTNKNFNKYVPTLLKRLRLLNSFEIEEIENLITNDDNEEANGSLMPGINDVIDKFKKDISPYIGKNPKEIKHIMLRINHFISNETNEGIALEDESIKKYTCEHIMPQKPEKNSQWISLMKEYSEKHNKDDWEFKEFYDHWVQNWGNLTITGDNQHLSNKDFDDKQTIFDDSILKLNKYIREQKEWTPTQIEERKSRMLNIIKKYF